MRRTSLPSFKFALLAASMISAPALAQEAQPQAAAAKDKEETIIVYGRGVEENTAATGLDLSPRETPQSISIITREQMTDQAAVKVSDVLEYTTGLSVKRVDRGRNLLSARGFDITNFQLDGQPFATGNVGLEETSTAIYERIEVIRGSTGLLQGAGEPSASINMVRKHATSRELTGELSLEAGSWDRFAGMADVTTPLNADGSVRGRFVAEAYTSDAFIDLEETKGYTLYGVIDADLSDRTRLRVGVSHQKDERSGVMWSQLPYWYSNGVKANWSRKKTTGADWNRWDTLEQTAFVTIEHDLSDRWSLRGDVSYHRQEEESKLIWMWGAPDQVTGLGVDGAGYWYDAEPQQWNLNFQVKGGYDLLGREHELVFGGMYNTLDTGWTNRNPFPASESMGNYFEWDGSYPEPLWGPRYDMSGIGTTEQTAVYGVTRLQVLDRLKVIVGGRLSSWERDEKVAAYTPSAYTIKHDNVFTPYAGAIFDLNDYVSAYASYTSIFNPQTARDRNGRYLDPLEGNNYEAGLKADLMDGRLRVSGAIFRIEQENYAMPDTDIDPDTGLPYVVPGTTDQASRAAKGTVSKGYELEMQGEVLPGWDVSAGYAQFKAEDNTGADVQAHQPRKVFRMATKYDFSGDFLERFSLGGSARWESRPPQTATNPGTGLTEKVGQPAYWLFNAFGSYDLTEQTALQVNVDNIFDKKYYNTNSWFGGYIYGEPRSVTVTLSHSF